MKLIIIRILLVSLLLADMIFIFANSAQEAVASADTSQNVTEVVAPVVVPNYKDMNETEKKDAVNALDKIVREAAHMIQFVPMGFALYLLLCTFPLPKKLGYFKLPFTVAFGALYALSDEVHQIFSPGRAFELFDIGMDTCGVVIGAVGGVCLMFIIKLVLKKRAVSSSADKTAEN